MPNKLVVCFILPSISKSAEDPNHIMGRIYEYCSSFIQAIGTQDSKAIVLTSGFTLTNDKDVARAKEFSAYVFKDYKVSHLRFLIDSHRILKLEQANKITLVAGDNYGALLVCLILRKILGGNMRVQISIHGNPLTYNNGTFKGVVRKLMFRFLVPRASSIRLVSSHLEEELRPYFGKNQELLVCPVPIVIPPLTGPRDSSSNIGVVGRLHFERGVDLLYEIMEEFAETFSALKFTIIGDGPERLHLEFLSHKYREFDLTLMGPVSHAEVLRSYSEFNLLLSCAPSEGYGLALREAILSGIPVVARENNGTRLLMDNFPEMVFLFNSKDDAVRIIKSKIDFRADVKTIENYRENQVSLDKFSMLTLVRSWS